MPHTLPRQPTIFDLAKAAGVSKSTVSAALLDDHRVSPRTRANIRLVARKMGYTRNAFAATLATRGQGKPARSLDVAIVSQVPVGKEYKDYDCIVIQKRLKELGYEGHHYDVFQDKISYEKLVRHLFHRGYCGVFFDQIYEKESEVFSVDWSAFSLIWAGRTHLQPLCDMVRPNQLQMISLAWKEVRAAGYRRIGFVLSRHHPTIMDDSEREAALWACQRTLEAGEEAIPPCLGFISDRVSFEKWYRRHRPDAVVGFNALSHLWLTEMGVRIPQDVAYANLHGDNFDGKVACIDQCLDEIRVKAAEHLDFLIRHKRTGFPDKPWEMLGPVRWIPGESLPLRS
jgi:LacI family transcriptional regulator